MIIEKDNVTKIEKLKILFKEPYSFLSFKDAINLTRGLRVPAVPIILKIEKRLKHKKKAPASLMLK
jgi:hypothetical protein